MRWKGKTPSLPHSPKSAWGWSRRSWFLELEVVTGLEAGKYAEFGSGIGMVNGKEKFIKTEGKFYEMYSEIQ